MDADFRFESGALVRAVELLGSSADLHGPPGVLPEELPLQGLGSAAALEFLASHVLGGAACLDAPDALAHMDPPTPWITWALSLWNARLNQNLLHPATAPFAQDAEARVVRWLAPCFGMDGGHMTPGSTVANLTALWAARDTVGVRRVVASSAAHLSIAKAARILGMAYEEVPVDSDQRLDLSCLPDLTGACLVLTAGTTSAGAIDPLNAHARAAWTHVDAAWAGPLRLSARHAHLLDGIECADSVSISAHKWLFQPKESALVLFRDSDLAQKALTFGGAYLAVPNVGVLGSHGAVAVPLLGTLLAFGRHGIAERLDRCMAAAERLADGIECLDSYAVLGRPQAGVVLFTPTDGDVDRLVHSLPTGMASLATINGKKWLRCALANPMVEIERVLESLGQVY